MIAGKTKFMGQFWVCGKEAWGNPWEGKNSGRKREGSVKHKGAETLGPGRNLGVEKGKKKKSGCIKLQIEESTWVAQKLDRREGSTQKRVDGNESDQTRRKARGPGGILSGDQTGTLRTPAQRAEIIQA